MAVPTIVVYSKSSNLNVLRLLDRKKPVILKTVTKIEIREDERNVYSSETHPQSIKWSVDVGNNRGYLYLSLGNLSFNSKDSSCSVHVFDDLNYRGVFWGFIRIRFFEGTLLEQAIF